MTCEKVSNIEWCVSQSCNSLLSDSTRCLLSYVFSVIKPRSLVGRSNACNLW